ncbi:PspC domain-containing protein [Clostridium frigidicarnis]|uniref:Phage shock protein PspC (Stress-responsive transcriptional regulator) n=1 Tax=Clostridium frigidicarnis TaxID=84698 RepID=A0A1I0XS13_9CLOT|nr:PspC domain-containing protein [Clostridium frigidicarnis]SFB02773.1 Phage shock protein PspC (stress-responsive transcriptional regulator) [Clostridium frigidicarnis]
MGKSLVRVKENSMFFGVCSGIAEYFNLELSKIRIAWVVSILFFGTGLLLYIVLAIVLNKKQYEDVSNFEINV